MLDSPVSSLSSPDDHKLSVLELELLLACVNSDAKSVVVESVPNNEESEFVFVVLFVLYADNNELNDGEVVIDKKMPPRVFFTQGTL